MPALPALATAALLVALAGCVATKPPGPPPPSAPGHGCNARPAQFALGHAYGEALAEEIRRRSGARILRAVRPGQAVTMEFNGERVTVQVDERERVVAVRCG